MHGALRILTHSHKHRCEHASALLWYTERIGMPDFTIINEIAVIGCTFLMLAISTIWYSSYMFGSLWKKHAPSITAPEHGALRRILFAAIAYAVMLSLLAYLLALSPLLQLSSFVASLCVFLFAAAFLAALCIEQGRSHIYFLIQAGFFFLFIVGGAFVIQYWPW